MLPFLVSERVEKVVQRHLVVTTQTVPLTGQHRIEAVGAAGGGG